MRGCIQLPHEQRASHGLACTVSGYVVWWCYKGGVMYLANSNLSLQGGRHLFIRRRQVLAVAAPGMRACGVGYASGGHSYAGIVETRTPPSLTMEHRTLQGSWVHWKM